MNIRKTILAAALALPPLALSATAQTGDFRPNSRPSANTVTGTNETTRQEAVRSSNTGVLRGLDKMTGAVTDLDIGVGETVQFGHLQVTLGDCRYPADNPSGDAYAFVVVRDAGQEQAEFQGWMVASSPALNALEDSRYDVWVLRCNS